METLQIALQRAVFTSSEFMLHKQPAKFTSDSPFSSRHTCAILWKESKYSLTKSKKKGIPRVCWYRRGLKVLKCLNRSHFLCFYSEFAHRQSSFCTKSQFFHSSRCWLLYYTCWLSWGSITRMLSDSLSQRANYNPFTIAIIRRWGQMTLLMIGQWPWYLISTLSHWLLFTPRSPGLGIFTFKPPTDYDNSLHRQLFGAPILHLGANIAPPSTRSLTLPFSEASAAFDVSAGGDVFTYAGKLCTRVPRIGPKKTRKQAINLNFEIFQLLCATWVLAATERSLREGGGGNCWEWTGASVLFN